MTYDFETYLHFFQTVLLKSLSKENKWYLVFHIIIIIAALTSLYYKMYAILGGAWVA